MDEIGNIPWPRGTSYLAWLHVMPAILYNDRPIGSAVNFFLYKTFGFNYEGQLTCFLLFHFANCILAFILFRRLGLRTPLSLAAVTLFASLSTTAQTATYIGASFDVLCTFFLLGSTILILEKSRLAWCFSALLYFLALRSKEFAIVIPVLFTVLILWRNARGLSVHETAEVLLRRLWLHYAVLALFGVWYLRLAISAPIPVGNPYHVSLRQATIVQSLTYYIALICSREDTHTLWLPAVAFLAIGIYALLRRNFGIVFALSAFFFTILPTSALPGIRSPYYVYCPAIFLMLALGFFLQDLINTLSRQERQRNWALLAALVLMGLSTAIESSAYFQNRVNWVRNARAACARAAASVEAQLASIGPASHVYVNHGAETPFLFVPGPCQFLRILRNDGSIDCVLGKPEEELKRLYDRDTSEKYYLDYRSDGSLSTRASEKSSSAD